MSFRRVPAATMAFALAVLLSPVSVPSASADSWRERVTAARDFAEDRRGRVSFAFVDERGRLRGGVRAGERFHSASLVKAMLLVAYLDRPGVRGRDLSDAERSLLGELIRHSGNRAATRVRNTVTNAGLVRVAARARMRDFATSSSWGRSVVTAADQARFFFRVDRLAPRRHRAFARSLLAGVVRSQRWGIAQAVPEGWTAYFKGGWRPEAGARLVHQAALLRRGGRRAALAVLTDGQPWHGYGTLTVRGIARRLLRDGPPR